MSMIWQRFRDLSGVVFSHIRVLLFSLHQIQLTGKYLLPLAPKVIKVIPEIRDQPALKATRVILELPVLLVQRVQMAPQGLQDPQGRSD